jgi:hypothetical protein
MFSAVDNRERAIGLHHDTFVVNFVVLEARTIYRSKQVYGQDYIFSAPNIPTLFI